MVFGFFFFQAEDGIRDLVRSRGLGDVYKRQAIICSGLKGFTIHPVAPAAWPAFFLSSEASVVSIKMGVNLSAVSYTHLTLPTSDLV